MGLSQDLGQWLAQSRLDTEESCWAISFLCLNVSFYSSYNLDLESPLKAHVLGTGPQLEALLGGGGTSKRWL